MINVKYMVVCTEGRDIDLLEDVYSKLNNCDGFGNEYFNGLVKERILTEGVCYLRVKNPHRFNFTITYESQLQEYKNIRYVNPIEFLHQFNSEDGVYNYV